MTTISTPTSAQLTAAFTEWFNDLVSRQPIPAQSAPSPNVVAAAPLTFAQIKELFAPAATPAAYSVYRALISQQGTDAPVATVLENTIGNIVWSRVAPGSYLASLSSAFPAAKTAVLINNSDDVSQTHAASIRRASDSTLNVITTDDVATGAAIDDILQSYFVQILVFP